MAFELEIFIFVIVIMIFLTVLAYSTDIGFLLVGSMVLGLFLDATTLSTGVANIMWGSVALSAASGVMLVVTVAVMVIIDAGMLLEMRYG